VDYTLFFINIKASVALFLDTEIAYDKVWMGRLNAKFIRPKFQVI
jgi:hypothetical protein